jgi:CRISPR/Cas system-associated protein Cas10 (large subunit of type III CRISPR-Cas system)
MRCKEVPGISAADAARMRLHAAFLEKRRLYNRRYMRRRRADPSRQSAEMARRQEWHYARKIRDSKEREQTDRMCGFCGVKQPVTNIARLQVSEIAPYGYVTVRVPYCGEC